MAWRKRLLLSADSTEAVDDILGQKLSEKLGIPCYDEKLIDMVAKESGFAQDFVAEKGERMTGSLLFNIASSLSYANNVFSGNGVSLQDEIYFIQNQIIKDLAEKGSCVIVGRCADYILRERDDVLNVFHPCRHGEQDGTEQSRILESRKDQAPALLKKKDKARSNHYKYYTDQDWGMASNYDLSLNSGVLGIDGCVEVIVKALTLRR